MNHFKLFNINQNYIIDQKTLDKSYFTMQIKYHPDRVKTEIERRDHLEHSMLINEAFKILKDDYSRAVYMLKLNGKTFDDSSLKDTMSVDELTEILEQHEFLEELSDKNSLQLFHDKKILEQKQLIADIANAFSNNNIKQAFDVTLRLKYLINLLQNIKLKIKNI